MISMRASGAKGLLKGVLDLILKPLIPIISPKTQMKMQILKKSYQRFLHVYKKVYQAATFGNIPDMHYTTRLLEPNRIEYVRSKDPDHIQKCHNEIMSSGLHSTFVGCRIIPARFRHQ